MRGKQEVCAWFWASRAPAGPACPQAEQPRERWRVRRELRAGDAQAEPQTTHTSAAQERRCSRWCFHTCVNHAPLRQNTHLMCLPCGQNSVDILFCKTNREKITFFFIPCHPRSHHLLFTFLNVTPISRRQVQGQVLGSPRAQGSAQVKRWVLGLGEQPSFLKK